MLALTILVAALLAPATPAGDRPDDARAEKDVAAASVKLTDAMVRGDATAVDEGLTEDWMLVTGEGDIVARSEVVGGMKGGTLKYHLMDKSELKVRVRGDNAVVTGRIRSRITAGDKEMSDTGRFTELFVRRGGVWRCASVLPAGLTARPEGGR